MPGFVDRQIDWLRKRVFLKPADLMGTLGASGVDTDATTAGITHIEIGTTGIVAPEVNTTEDLSGIWHVPYDFDPKFSLGLKVHFTADIAASNTLTWTILYDVKIATAIAAATTALDTPLTASSYTNAAGDAVTTPDWIPQVSSRGIIKATSLGISHDNVNVGRTWIMFNITATETNYTSLRFLGLELDYTPRRCVGTGKETDAPYGYKGTD